ncbi:MAG: hypothetical protein U5O39_00645 [Gammaproteobacteria bacterium]|nr:hypothetical protein [Gammaproteobacteria bacterium]
MPSRFTTATIRPRAFGVNQIGFPIERSHPSRATRTISGPWATPVPAGPCSEIFYDHGPGNPAGPPGTEDGDLDRYIEILKPGLSGNPNARKPDR